MDTWNFGHILRSSTNEIYCRPLSKEELEELSKEQKQQYFEELADREKLFQKKQWREELRRRKEMKKRAAAMSKEELSQPADEAEDEAGRAAAVPVPMPDMALPPSFDSDNPTHRYQPHIFSAICNLFLEIWNGSDHSYLLCQSS
jgi:hypothetical protein